MINNEIVTNNEDKTEALSQPLLTASQMMSHSQDLFTPSPTVEQQVEEVKHSGAKITMQHLSQEVSQ